MTSGHALAAASCDLTSTNNTPILPPELLQYIAEITWRSFLYVDERTMLLESLPLVNKSFLAIYNYLCIREVYIPNHAFSQHYHSLLAPCSPIKTTQPSPRLTIPSYGIAASELQQLTFHISGGPGYPDPRPIYLRYNNHHACEALSNILHRLKYSPSSAHNLKHVTIEYANWGYNDLLDNGRLEDLPDSVNTLEVKFRFDGEISDGILRSLRMRYYGRIAVIGSLNHANSANQLGNGVQGAEKKLPGVKTLSVSGACLELVMDLVHMCANLECLEVDETMDLEELAWYLPRRVRTLVLGGEEGVKLSVELLLGIRFSHALREGLMSSARDEAEEEHGAEEERKIVLVTSCVEERALEMAMKDCELHKVRLVHSPITDIV